MATPAALSALCLVAPWAGSGAVDRSTVELIASATALDLLDDGARIVVLGGWYLVVVLAAGSVLAAGWDRARLTAWCALPMGPLMGLVTWVLVVSPFAVKWGAVLGTVAGVTASSVAVLLLMHERRAARGTT